LQMHWLLKRKHNLYTIDIVMVMQYVALVLGAQPVVHTTAQHSTHVPEQLQWMSS
jgi:hypothetical protein